MIKINIKNKKHLLICPQSVRESRRRHVAMVGAARGEGGTGVAIRDGNMAGSGRVEHPHPRTPKPELRT